MLLNLNFKLSVISFIFLKIFAYATTAPNSNPVKLTSIVKPFSDCTTIVYVFQATKLLLDELPTSPIVLFKKEAYQTEFSDSKTLERCSFIRRKNPSKHCRAFLIIQPERSQLFPSQNGTHKVPLATVIYREIYYSIFYSEFYVPRYCGPQYIMWVTTARRDLFQINWTYLQFDYHSNQQCLLFSFSFEEIQDIQIGETNRFLLYHFNRYYENTARKWLPIVFNFNNEFDCYQRIEFVSITISLLNKYFWDSSSKWRPLQLNHSGKLDDFTIANYSEQFAEYLPYWILWPLNVSVRSIHWINSESGF